MLVLTILGSDIDEKICRLSLRSSLFCDVTQRKLNSLILKVGALGCPETSVTTYQSTLRNIPEERISRLHRGGSLKQFTVCNNLKKYKLLKKHSFNKLQKSTDFINTLHQRTVSKCPE
jgi:hypothetical protein